MAFLRSCVPAFLRSSVLGYLVHWVLIFCASPLGSQSNKRSRIDDALVPSSSSDAPMHGDEDEFEEDEDYEEPDIVIDPALLSAARAKQLSSVVVSVVASLVHVLVMAAQGSGSFAVSDDKGDVFDELIQLSGKPASKTFYQRGADTSSKLTGCLVSATDDDHANALVKLAPQFHLSAIKVADIRASGDSRALSFIKGVNNLTIDSRFFPVGDFNFHETTHRTFLAWNFLVYFGLFIPAKEAALAGLEFRVVSTSLTKATRQLKTTKGVSRSITG